MKRIEFDGITIDLTLKKIKNIHLRVLAPHGEVRISAPLRIGLSEINKFIAKKADWIHQARNRISSRKIAPEKHYESGEKHYFLGKEYELKLCNSKSRQFATLHHNIIELHIKQDSNRQLRKKILDEFYRLKLKEIIPHHITALETTMKVQVAEFGIKKMKTRWGTCNPRARRIWINLELAKKPPHCLEFIVTHEMVHLLERNHSKRFFALMDHFMPNWRECNNELNQRNV